MRNSVRAGFNSTLKGTLWSIPLMFLIARGGCTGYKSPTWWNLASVPPKGKLFRIANQQSHRKILRDFMIDKKRNFVKRVIRKFLDDIWGNRRETIICCTRCLFHGFRTYTQLHMPQGSQFGVQILLKWPKSVHLNGIFLDFEHSMAHSGLPYPSFGEMWVL